MEGILARFPVFPFDLAVARQHAALWAEMLRQGAVIGAHDLQIAATAPTHGFTLLTRDARHFGRIEGLLLELI